MPPVQKVLLVDDDSLQLAVVQAWLSSAGFDVISRDTPIGTTQMVLGHRPDLLVVDCEMPILAGPEMVEILVKRVKTVAFKVIFYSWNPLPVLDDMVKRFPGVVLGAILKTTDGEKFMMQVSRMLRASRIAK